VLDFRTPVLLSSSHRGEGGSLDSSEDRVWTKDFRKPLSGEDREFAQIHQKQPIVDECKKTS